MATCKICASERRTDIQTALAQGMSIREAAAAFGFNRGAVHRHAQHAEERDPARNGNAAPTDSQRRLRALYERVERLLAKAEKNGDMKSAAALLGQLDDIGRRIVEPGQLRDRGGVCSCDNPTIRVVEDDATPKNPNSHSAADQDRWLLSALEALATRTSSDKVAACAVRLASLLLDRPLSGKLGAEVTRLEGTDVP